MNKKGASTINWPLRLDLDFDYRRGFNQSSTHCLDDGYEFWVRFCFKSIILMLELL
jgi:hypothetical protein